MMGYNPRSNVLIEHVLGEQTINPGDTWRLRKGKRLIVLDEVFLQSVAAHDARTGRKTTLTRESLLARYIKEGS
jgi:hypothetical protein